MKHRQPVGLKDPIMFQREFIDKRNSSVIKLAGELGVSKQTIYSWIYEKNIRPDHRKNILDKAESLGLSNDYDIWFDFKETNYVKANKRKKPKKTSKKTSKKKQPPKKRKEHSLWQI